MPDGPRCDYTDLGWLYTCHKKQGIGEAVAFSCGNILLGYLSCLICSKHFGVLWYCHYKMIYGTVTLQPTPQTVKPCSTHAFKKFTMQSVTIDTLYVCVLWSVMMRCHGRVRESYN